MVCTMDSASLVNNAEPIFPAVQAQATYPQPQPAYAQPAYAQPAYPYPQAQNTSITMTSDIKEFFGYVRSLRIISIIYLVGYIIFFPALIFVWYPIIGMNVNKKWNESSFACFNCWSWFLFVSNTLSTVYYLYLCFTGATLPDGTVVSGSYYLSSFFSSCISTFITYMVVRIATAVKKGLYKYQILDIMTKAAYTKLYMENEIPCKCW